ncbi:MAG: tyrosine-type recombinase/integrase [Sphingobacteriia bacterium]|nr:tyrosine-type recombinase/integrase [Sphingobacteriia bacterium]
MNEITLFEPKLPSIEVNKINQKDSISYWFEIYFTTQIIGSPHETLRAKKRDIIKFLNYFHENFKTNHIDYWTTSVVKGFQGYLLNIPYSATTINRIFATLRHAANWINKQRPFLAGNPFTNIRDVIVDDPAWKGLTDDEIRLLEIGCNHRIAICKKANQNPYLEVAVFYTLLYTGMRRFELVNLNISQYYNSGFHNVVRKGRKITRKIHVPKEAKERIEQYLATRKEYKPEDPLFVTKNNNRLDTRDVHRICQKIAAQASAQLPEKIKLSPHMLRHSILKRIAEKHGHSAAHALSGNVSASVVFNYTKPSADELENQTENIFN